MRRSPWTAFALSAGILWLAGCGGGSRSLGQTVLPPARLSYSSSPAVYTKDLAITPNSPSSSGGPVAAYVVSPGLPVGLMLNAATGLITGKPTVASGSVSYTVTASNAGGSATVLLNIRVNEPIYRLTIDQTNPAEIILKDPVTPASATLSISGASGVVLPTTPMTIEGRGNSTWYYSFLEYPNRKLPYKFEFANRVDVLGMGPSKRWVLLANRFDKSLMKNMLAFDLAQGLSFAFTNRYRLVELYLNGDYKGLYLITDQLEVDETLRVRTGTTSPTSDTEPGFLLEWDNKITTEPTTVGVDYFWLAGIGQPLAFKGPKVKELNAVPGNAARAYIISYMTQASAALLDCKTGTPGQDRHKDYVEVTSFYDYFIVNELTKNTDAARYSSIYMNKPKGQKLSMGPVWDFDIAFGWLDGVRSPTEWYIRDQNPWLKALIRDNAEFAAGLRARWNNVKAGVRVRLIDGIDAYEVQLQEAADRNHARWGELSAHIVIWTGEQQYPVVSNSYADVVAYLRGWANARYTWLDAQINGSALTSF